MCLSLKSFCVSKILILLNGWPARKRWKPKISSCVKLSYFDQPVLMSTYPIQTPNRILLTNGVGSSLSGQ